MVFVLAFVVAVAVVLWAYKKAFTEFWQFEIVIAMVESVIGIYVGQFVYSIFKNPDAA